MIPEVVRIYILKKNQRLLNFILVFLAASCVANKSNIKTSQPEFLNSVDRENTNAEKYKDNFIDEGEDELSEDEMAWRRDAAGLTNNYTSFPSSYEVTNFLNRSLSSPNPTCDQFEDNTENPSDENSPTNPSLRGAHKVFATFFQSCNVFDDKFVINENTPNLRGVQSIPNGNTKLRRVTSQRDYVNSHIILNSLDQKGNYPGEQCVDVRDKPPVYGYGSRKLPNNSGEINLFSKGGGVTGNSQEASGIDCSSFISVALGTQGLKVKKDAGPFTSMTTRDIQTISNSQNSCLKSSTFSEKSSIQAGDIINVAGSHVIMVDQVGDDPLAIKKFAKNNNCKNIQVTDFDFTYIHSGAVNNSYGPSRVHISKHRGGEMFNNLRQTAVKACLNIVAGKTSAMRAKDLNYNRNFDIIRHNSSDPSCVSDRRVKLKNEDCINGCFDKEKS